MVQKLGESEEDVLHSLKQGNVSALSNLYKIHVDQLYGFVLKIAKSPTLADDVVQDTFIRIWESRHNIDTSKPFKPLLYTVARRHLLNLLRRASHEQVIVSEIKQYTTFSENVTDLQTEFLESNNILNDAIRSLSPRMRDVFVRCKIDGYSYKEVANEFGISEGTVNSQIVKATKSVRKFFQTRGMTTLFFLFFF
ncbi:RNA polymerase sigma-70 factor (ECF subfamily) [Arcticibacter pallidicorallinus]|uniref:RNA polymerase sigma-70 factor (ECF subfamily) n=1 Tax=Arcticibacter pallidicorallinus TaxID=1259464 RepID=A0A2T0TU28_9SPHI|nr:RNA polymerase sigma factor [Arcticibacter pallidicorallinus]PRY49212.1 RNA polymerase sigma-70 factor (ECF subfamily) [Arcticibacter pallidicorallinus]